MATSSPRDVKLRLSTETAGEDQVKSLAKEIRELAKAGGDAAPEFEHLAAEVEKLGEQQKVLTSFQALSDQLVEITAKQATATETSERYAQSLRDAAAAAEQARTNQAQAAQAQATAARALQDTRDELTRLRNTYTETGARVDGYKAQVLALTNAKIADAAAEREAAAALREANKAVTEAERAEAKLEKAYQTAARASEEANAAVRQQGAVLLATTQAAEALGASTTNLASEQARIASSFSTIGRSALELRAEVEQLAAAEAELARQNTLKDQAADAAALARASDYVAEMAVAVSRLEEEERALAAQKVFEQQAADAAALARTAEHVEALRVQVLLLEREEEELAAQRAFEKQAADARNLVKASEYVRFWETSLEQAEAQARQTAEAAAAAAAKITSAFSTVGVRGVQELEKEIVDVRAAMQTLQTISAATGQSLTGAFTAGETKIKSLERELRELNGQLTTGDKLAKLFSNSIGQIAAGNIVADGVGYLVNKVKEMGREFVAAITQMESMRRGLTAIYGSASLAASQIDFLRNAANGAGISMSSIADSFVRFSASTRSANIPLQVTNDLFVAVTRAGATLGLSGERVTLVLDALGQMASKGVVSMEELRQQLGDSLPGALSLAAKGLGITDAALVKLVEAGQLAAADLFPALTKGLKDLQGSADTLTSRWEQLKNALNQAAVQGGDAGWTDVLKGGLTALRYAAGLVVLPLAALSEVIFGLAKAAGVLVSALVTLSNPLEALAAIADEASARQAKLTETFDGTSTAMQTQATQTQALAAAQGTGTSATLALAAAQAQAMNATVAAGTAAAGTGNAYVQMLSGLQQNTKAIETHIVATEKLQKAKEIEGKAAIQTAQLSGNQVSILLAQTEAANDNVAATEAVVLARKAEAQQTEETIAKIQALGVANGGLREDQRKLIETMQQKLEAQNAAVEKSVQERNELQATANAASVAAIAYRDNSAALQTYGLAFATARDALPGFVAALKTANDAVALQKQLLLEGKGSQEAVTAAQAMAVDATNKLAQAKALAAASEALYNDALKDTLTNLDLQTRAQTANLSGSLALINVGKQHAETMAQIARAQGNTTQATYYEIEAKQKQIEAIRLTTQIKELEARGDIAALEIKKQEIALNDPLRDQKLKELDIRIKLQQVKLLEAAASKDVIRGIEQEITTLRNGASQLGQHTSATQSNTSARYENVNAMKAQKAAQDQLTSDGFKANADGSAAGSFSNSAPVDKAFNVLDRQRAGTLTAADLADAQAGLAQISAARDLLKSMQELSAGSVNPQTLFQYQVMEQRLKDTVANLQGQANAGTGTGTADGANASGSSTATQSTTTGSGTTHSVNITLNGKTQTINTSSASDASKLASLLASLEQAAGTSS